jgi:hypothetical protein
VSVIKVVCMYNQPRSKAVQNPAPKSGERNGKRRYFYFRDNGHSR